MPVFLFLGSLSYGDVEVDADAAIEGAVDADGLTCVMLTPPTPNQCATAKP